MWRTRNRRKLRKSQQKNKANAAKKIYHHTMGAGGYAFSMPKWEKLAAVLLANGITPEPLKWIERARNWFYGHGGHVGRSREVHI